MAGNTTALRGKVHGKTIELDEDTGLPDGETVAVTIQRVEQPSAAVEPDAVPRVELWADRLEFDSTVLPGERIVKGTRLAAETLVAELERGRSDEEMLQAHPELTREDLVALRHFARTPMGLRRSFGAWAEDADELDEFLERNRQRRKLKRKEINP